MHVGLGANEESLIADRKKSRFTTVDRVLRFPSSSGVDYIVHRP